MGGAGWPPPSCTQVSGPAAGSCLLGSSPGAWLGVVVRWAQAGQDPQVGLASEEGAPHPLVEAVRTGASGSRCTPPHPGLLLWVAEWSLGIRRAEVRSQPIPSPLGSEEKVLGAKPMWRRPGCVTSSINQLLVPILVLPVDAPGSPLAQAEFLPIVAAGHTTESLGPVDVSRKATKLGRYASCATGRVILAATGPSTRATGRLTAHALGAASLQA